MNACTNTRAPESFPCIMGAAGPGYCPWVVLNDGFGSCVLKGRALTGLVLRYSFLAPLGGMFDWSSVRLLGFYVALMQGT